MSERRQHVQELRRGAKAHGIPQVPDNAARGRVKVVALALLEADLSDDDSVFVFLCNLLKPVVMIKLPFWYTLGIF